MTAVVLLLYMGLVIVANFPKRLPLLSGICHINSIPFSFRRGQ
jgi:hypothetical protein